MYLSITERAMLEATLFNLRHDMNCIGLAVEMQAELLLMSDVELETALNSFIASM